MLLKTININNIRSYSNQTINLNKGSTVLAGDIGCGKSSLLLAIEFALFGTSRPDLPAEALLRKGEVNASVELSFILEGKEIIIKRNLKKDKNSIKQTAGHIIINGIKKELTAIELKSEIVNLLGYPEEFISKNKNYIFRYTVYTPQEEMKFILYENSDTRLDILRKIFNVEKYGLVRDNVQHVLKQMRVSLAILRTKLEKFDEKKRKLLEYNEQEASLKEAIKEINQPLQEILEKIELQTKKIEILEISQKERQNFLLELASVKALINEKGGLIEKLFEKREALQRQLEELKTPEHLTEERLLQEIASLEFQEKERLGRNSKWQEKIKFLQNSVLKVKQEFNSFEERLKEQPELLKQITAVKKNLSEKNISENKIKQIEDLFERTNSLITKNKTVLNQAEELKNKILNLESCPTCLQDVSEDHKNAINETENLKISEAKKILKELKLKKEDVCLQREKMQKEKDEVYIKKNLLVKLESQLEVVKEILSNKDKKQEELKQLVQENNLAMKELELLSKEKSLQEQIEKLQKIKVNVSKKNILSKNLAEVETQIKSTRLILGETEKRLLDLNVNLKTKNDKTEEILIERKQENSLKEQEKEVTVKKVELETNLNNLLQMKKEISEEIFEMQEMENKKTKLRGIYNWLNSYFLPLTYTIEKHVMGNIYNVFNQIFQEWFAILIDNENISARLDDSFNPVIEQNGYEISFINLSGGEKTSTSLSYRLALNKVINDVISQIKTKDILILDEPTDGFSTEQLDKVRDVLDRLQLRQTIIVSHESKIESFVQNVVRIGKEGNESIVI
jgi:DNA repair protein SbcC/Rad50